MQLQRQSVALWLLGAAVVGLGWELLLRISYELSGVLTDDALIYLAVGRGILNGLTPYRDLFETKPPGIFLLNAASLFLTGGTGPLKIVQSLALLTVTGVVPVGTWLRVRKLPRSERTTALLLATIFGILLALFAATMAGEGQVESFGVAFALVALLGMSTGMSIMTIFGILGAAGMKEPFLLSILASALILQLHIGKHFLRPCVLAIAVGLVALSLLGYLPPYLTIYLPHMLGTHAVAHVPLWQRSFAIDRLLANITSFSLPLAASTVVLLLGTLLALRTTRVLGALWLILLAVGMGGDFYGHHFIFAVPFLVACFWSVQALRLTTVLVGVLLLGAGVFHHRSDYASARNSQEERRTELTEIASAIDAIMDRCTWERYLHLKPKGGGPFAYTHHSPEGPIFTQYSRFMGFEGSPFIEPFKQVLLQTPLILLTDLESIRMTEIAKRYIRTNFSPTPPVCAGNVPTLPEEYSLLFRL